MENQTTTLLDSVDPEILATVSARSAEISQGASVNGKIAAALALGSIPIALGVLSKEAFGQAPSDVLDVLQFALTLEYLEAEFYTRGVAAAGLIATGDVALFTTIRDHENTHVTALQGLIRGKGATPGSKPAFDFTAKGNVPGFNFTAGQYETFKVLAQAFEDTGVRAYKGQAGRLMNDKPILNAALSIHSVEARHASEVRRLRGKKGWITGKSRDDLPAFTQGIYEGEDNTMYAGLDANAFGNGNGGIGAVQEAFDEPLTKAEVLAIVSPFLA